MTLHLGLVNSTDMAALQNSGVMTLVPFIVGSVSVINHRKLLAPLQC